MVNNFHLRRSLDKVQFVTKANNCCLRLVIDTLQPPKRKKNVTQSLYGYQYHGSKRYFEQYKPVSFILIVNKSDLKYITENSCF